MSRRPRIEVARERYELQRLAVASAALARKQSILAKYDAVEPSNARRQPTREMTGEAGVYDMTRRLLGCNLGRDLERNYSPARAMLHQFRVNVVGSEGKLRVNTPEGGDDAAAWFNEIWAKDCDARDSLDWSTLLQNILAAGIRDGDALLVVDDNLTSDDSGRLWTWEADQIAPVSDNVLRDAEKFAPYRGAVQDQGILRDKMGRVLAYIASGKRGLAVLDSADDATPWAREAARLYRNPWRLNQGRGVPALLTPSTNLIDLYEILASELGSAKRAAKQYAYVKRANAVTDWDNPAGSPEFLPENDGRTSTEVAADGANQTTHTARNYERLEALTGGLTDYLDPADDVQFPNTDRPNIHLAEFMDAVNGMSGAALGLAFAYTRLRADSSYTAFRGDMILTWVTFKWLQKHLERTVADWVAVRVLRWAQRKGAIPALPAGWERALSWSWPTMPEVNELDAQNAIAAALKNGTTDYSKLLGPDWRRRLEDFAEMVETIRELNLPLKVLETASGGVVKQPPAEPPERGTDDDTEE